jgi:membrane protein DedA with SNARE-associated domain
VIENRLEHAIRRHLQIVLRLADDVLQHAEEEDAYPHSFRILRTLAARSRLRRCCFRVAQLDSPGRIYSAVVEWITRIITALGYFGIALLTLLENLFPPIPSEIIMPMAGFTAAVGDISLAGAIVAGSIGSLAGCTGWYFVGRKIGEARLRTWVERHGRWLTLSIEDIDKAKGLFQRKGAAVVFIGRLIPGIRTWISVPAGFSGMSLWKFLIYSAAGTVVWTALLTCAGYVLGANYKLVSNYLGPVSTVVFAIIAVWYGYRVIKRKGS